MTFVKAGATGVSVIFQLVDDAGLEVTGRVAATLPSIYWARAGELLSPPITLVDLETEASSWVSGGVAPLSNGYYRLCVPNAAFATINSVRIFGEASGMHVIYPPIDCGLDLSGTTVGTLTDVASALANKLAHVILRRTMAAVEASADGETLDVSSLYGFLQMAQESSRSGATLTIKKTDGTTTLGTKTLTQDANANPITGVS